MGYSDRRVPEQLTGTQMGDDQDSDPQTSIDQGKPNSGDWREGRFTTESPTARHLAGGTGSASANPSSKVSLIRARHETLIWQILVGWREAASTGNRGPRPSGKQQLMLRNRVIEMEVELGHAEGRELLARSRSPEQFESDLSNLLESRASNAAARWRSFIGRYQLRKQPNLASSWEAEISRSVMDQLTLVAESLILEAWSAHRARLETEGCPEAPPTTYSEAAAACSQAMRTSDAPNETVADLRNEKGMTGPASSESSSDVAVEALAASVPMNNLAERGKERSAFVRPRLASKGWSRSRWAAEAGVGKSCVYEYLRGARQPSSENRRALAEALAVRSEDLPE